MKLKRLDASDDGCNFFGGFFKDGESPFWVSLDRAIEATETQMRYLESKYGYQFERDSNSVKRDILEKMKSGEITKESGILQLKSLHK